MRHPLDHPVWKWITPQLGSRMHFLFPYQCPRTQVVSDDSNFSFQKAYLKLSTSYLWLDYEYISDSGSGEPRALYPDVSMWFLFQIFSIQSWFFIIGLFEQMFKMTDASEYSNGNLSSAFAAANRGALTTIFTPPGTCLTETTLVSYLTTSDSSTDFFTTTKSFINHFSWGDPDCYPSTIATISGYTRWNNGYYYCETPHLIFLAIENIDDKLSTRNMSKWVDISVPADGQCVGFLNYNR